ncbi:unnamed protein product [Urochloa decumbens]|uniref:Uncharacterized protein n=1 Tax=Urochloa decumbens TaxID=240449 RepID=A0ABC9B6E1_9POAL
MASEQSQVKNGDQSKKKPVFHKSMGTVAGLRKLLPAGTTLAFETMAPAFTRGGQCNDHDVNFGFTWWLIGFLTLLCMVLSFTDSFTDKDGNTHYGVATCKGFMLFNGDLEDLQLSGDELRPRRRIIGLSTNEHENRMLWKDLKRRMKRKPRDFLHAFFSSAVFVALAFCNAEVQACLVPTETWQWKKLLTILPLAVGFLASFVFVIFPSTRKGIGQEDGSWGAMKRGNMAAAPGGGQQDNRLDLQAMSITRVAPSTSYQLVPVV